MTRFTGFSDSEVWKQAIALLKMLMAILCRIRGPGAADLIDQLARAADSVHSNIAEGYGKGLCPDQVRYLKIARCSAAEVETRLEGAIATARTDEATVRPVILQAKRVQALISGYIRYVERRITELQKQKKTG